MTSPKQPKLVPVLSDEVKAKTSDGIYKIELPKANDYKMPMNGKTVPAIQLRCQSLYAKKPNEVHCCNSVVKTIIGNGTGDQTELIECGKCRTAYLIRTQYTDDKALILKMAVWDTGRNIKQFGEFKNDKDYNYWVEFNKEK